MANGREYSTFHGSRQLLHGRSELRRGLSEAFRYYPPLPSLIASDWAVARGRPTPQFVGLMRRLEPGPATAFSLERGDHYGAVSFDDSVFRVKRALDPMVKLVREAVQQGKVVAAICHAGWMLASAGAVKGKKVTSFFSIKDDMVNAGGQWSDSEVVVDGNLITSRKPDDLPAFCREIVRALTKTG